MALVDARILRSLKISESKSDKGSVQISATQELLILSDTKDPAFNEILANDAVWPNLGNSKLPQIDDETVVNGVTLYVTSRSLSYFKDNERAVVMEVRYDAKTEEDGGGGEPPEGSDPATWKKITVASQQITKPAIGWPTLGVIPAENEAGEGSGAQNSAGDPIDGLEEEASMVKLTYTNTQVLHPSFTELNRYLNRCNSAGFLNAGIYQVRMIGWNAEYDQRNNVWSVSVEFLYAPDGWQIRYFDVGYNEIVDGERRAILDQRGNPVSKPVPLNGQGQAQTINPSPTGDEKPTEPQELELYPYRVADMSNLFANCRI
jgi:hypothetical protein